MAVGKKLKEKREELSISIEEAEDETKIRKKYLRAMENDNYEDMPGLVYARAFLKTYSSFLGLDPEEIQEEFERWRHLEDVDADLEEGRIKKRRSRRSKKSGLLTSLFSMLSLSPRSLLIIFVLVLLGGGVAYNFIIMNDAEHESPQEMEETAPVEEEIDEEEVEILEEESPDDLALEEDDINIYYEEELLDQFDEPLQDINLMELNGDEIVDADDDEEILVEEDPEDEETAGEPAPGEVEPEEELSPVILTVTDTSWVRATVDGEIVLEDTLEEGDVEEFTPEESFHIRTGNAGGLQMEIEGEDEGALGDIGEVLEVEYEF